MKKRIFMSVLMLSAIVALAACGGSDTQNSTGSDAKETTETSSKKEQTNNTDEKSSVETKVDKLMEKMTLEEKVGQLFLARVPEQNQIADIENYHLGGYLLFDRDMEGKGQSELKQTIASYQSASKTPMFIASDEEGGTVSRLSRNQIVTPAFASPQAIYQKDGWDGITKDI